MSGFHRFTYYFLKGFAAGFHSLPKTGQKIITGIFCFLLKNIIKIRLSQAKSNISKAFPEKSELERTKILNNTYPFFVNNIFQFIGFPKSFNLLDVQVTGAELLDQGLKEGRGVILVMGHFGFWEAGITWLGENKYPVYGVAQRQKNRGADQFFREIREKSKIVQMDKKTTSVELIRHLKKNRILLLVSDQDAKNRGDFVNFFNHPSSTPKGAAIFHLRSGAPIIYGSVKFEPPFNVSLVFSEVKVAEKRHRRQAIIQSFTSKLEADIQKNPEQYFWFHKRWKTKPPAENHG